MIKHKEYKFYIMLLYETMIVDIVRCISMIVAIPTLADVVTPFRNILYVIVLLLILWSNRKNYDRIVIITFLFLLGLVFTFLISPNVKTIFFEIVLFLFARALPGILFIMECDDWRGFANQLIKTTWLPIIYSCLTLINNATLKVNAYYDYDMSFSYNLLLPCIVAFYAAYALKRRKYYFVVLFFVVLVLAYGARGTVISIAVGIFFSTLLFHETGKNRAVYKLTLLLLCFILLFAFSDSIISTLYNIFPSSRTLHSLIYMNFFQLSNRDKYYSTAIEILKSSPLQMRGFAGDCVALADTWGQIPDLGTHAHNMFLEIFLDCGMIIGTIVVFAIIYGTIKTYFIAYKNIELAIPYVFFVVSSLPFLMVSSSLMRALQAWLLIATVKKLVNQKSRLLLNKTRAGKPLTLIKRS